MNTEQSPPPYNPYYPPQHPNATQFNAGQPTAGMMPPVVEQVNMGIPDSAPPEYTLGFENENCFSDATIRRGQCSLETTLLAILNIMRSMFLDILN